MGAGSALHGVKALNSSPLAGDSLASFDYQEDESRESKSYYLQYG